METLRIGTSAYYNRHWKGVFYPEGLATKNWFAYYCEHFDTFEINASFYRFPTVKSLRAWYEKSPEGFLFAVKAPRLITHFRKFSDCAEELSKFYANCTEGLSEKLGWILFQMPPSFQYSEDHLSLLTQNLQPGFPNVVEFRHASWWREDVLEALEQHGIVFCSASYPGLPDKVVSTCNTAYVRMHGKPKLFYSDYPDEEIRDLLEQLRHIKTAVVYWNNTASEAGIRNALAMAALSGTVGKKYL